MAMKSRPSSQLLCFGSCYGPGFDIIRHMPNQEYDMELMTQALTLARRGRGCVEPNPPVGAVIARDGRVLASGWHKRFGGPHAERDALAAATDAGLADEIRGATMYVTLEPCCHQGKTPPCTEAIIQSGIARVVVAMLDVDQRVSGNGVEILRQAGIEVHTGVCESQATQLLSAYVKLRTHNRPWVICKWAQTTDGYLSLPPEAGRWITGPAARERVHEIRSWCDGILVGADTIVADDPLLTDRSDAPAAKPTNPAPTRPRDAGLWRVILDSTLRTNPSARVITTAGETPTIVATTHGAVGCDAKKAAALSRYGAELLELPDSHGRVDIDALLDELGKRQWTNLLVEGGSAVLDSFIRGGLADELMAFVSPKIAGDNANLPQFDIRTLAKEIHLPAPAETQFDQDTLLRYHLNA